MPNYKTHVKINCLVLFPAHLAAVYFFINQSLAPLAIFSATFIYATFFMNPDLDLRHSFRLTSLRGILTLPFLGYSRFFKHRGLSHHWLIGTCSRLVWLAILAGVIGFFACELRPEIMIKYFQDHYLELAYGCAGVFCADLSHLLTDYLKK